MPPSLPVPVPVSAPPQVAIADPGPVASDLLAVELNLASATELGSIAGIGPSLSRRLLIERQCAPFDNWRDMVARLKTIGWHAALRWSRSGLRVAGQAHPDDQLNDWAAWIRRVPMTRGASDVGGGGQGQ